MSVSKAILMGLIENKYVYKVVAVDEVDECDVVDAVY